MQPRQIKEDISQMLPTMCAAQSNQLSRHPAELLFRSGLRTVGATSGTFYVPDPYWAGDLRLALIPGVQFCEPLFGFLYPKEALLTVTDGPDDADCRRYRHLNKLRACSNDNITLTGSFAEREGLSASVRMKRTVNGKVKAVMFANFVERTVRLEPAVLSDISSLFNDLVESIPSVTRHICNVAPFPVADLVAVLKPFHALPGLLYGDRPSSLESYLRDVLSATLHACGVNEKTSFGTIHLYDKSTQTLKLEAAVGSFNPPDPDDPGLAVPQWEGIVSWVANRRAPLFVHDLDSSAFRKFHLPMCKNAVSELAVPMMAGDELIGVFNIESTVPLSTNFVGAHDIVRIAWHAASQAAVACRMQSESEMLEHEREIADRHAATTRDVLSVCSDLPNLTNSDRPLDQVARLATQLLDGMCCDLWYFDDGTESFAGLGADYEDAGLDEPPRQGDGWSHFISKHDACVWIGNISSATDFHASIWDVEKSEWKLLNGDSVPSSLNSRLVQKKVGSEFGLPIRQNANVIGVAWVKYKRRNHALPTPEEVDLANAFAGECSLVIASLELQKATSRITSLRAFERMVQALRHDAPDRFLGRILHDLGNLKDVPIPSETKRRWTECLSVLRAFLWNVGVLLPTTDKGRIDPKINQEALRPMLEAVVSISDLVLEKPEVVNNIDDSCTVKCDAGLTKLAMYLLIDNSRKYSITDNAGPITLSYSDGRLQIIDCGMGITEELLKEIGRTIGKRKNPPGKSIGGIGLGTYLARQLLKRQGFDIRWDSDGVTGTTVTITF